MTSNCGVALQSRKIGGQPDTLLVAGGSRGLKAAMAHEGVRRWLQQGGAAHATATARSAPAPSCWPRPGLLDGKRVATHWASCARLAERFPALVGRCRGALRRRRQGLDLGRRHHRHRHGAGAGRGRSRRGDRQPDRAPLRALCPPAGLPVAVQPDAAGAGRGRRAVRRADRLDAGPSRPRARRADPGARMPATASAASIASSPRRPARRRRISSRTCGSMRRARCCRRACRSRRSPAGSG